MLDAYRGIAPESVLREIAILSEALRGRTLQHINSTRVGGGVAELLARMVPLTESLGIPTTWDVIQGNNGFFEVTKAMHNALQGADLEISHGDRQVYLECLQENARHVQLNADVVIVHDPQPVYLVDYCSIDRRRLVWRCHIDLSKPDDHVWRFLQRAVRKYAMAVFHVPQFAQSLPIPQVLIAPSIDPLSEKNRELSEDEITAVTDRFGIDRRRPSLVQVSRFDRFKDPLGVIDWDEARIGDPAYDFAIVTRGSARPFKTAGALRLLVDAYNQRVPNPVYATDVHVYELCLVTGFYRQHCRDYGTGSPHAENTRRKLANLLRRAEETG